MQRQAAQQNIIRTAACKKEIYLKWFQRFIAFSKPNLILLLLMVTVTTPRA
jgi:hypothetical protein